MAAMAGHQARAAAAALPVQVSERVPDAAGSVAIGTEQGTGFSSELCLLVGSAYRTEIGLDEIGVGHGLLLHAWLGGIREIASGANRPEPLPTELNQNL